MICDKARKGKNVSFGECYSNGRMGKQLCCL